MPVLVGRGADVLVSEHPRDFPQTGSVSDRHAGGRRALVVESEVGREAGALQEPLEAQPGVRVALRRAERRGEDQAMLAAARAGPQLVLEQLDVVLAQYLYQFHAQIGITDRIALDAVHDLRRATVARQLLPYTNHTPLEVQARLGVCQDAGTSLPYADAVHDVA